MIYTIILVGEYGVNTLWPGVLTPDKEALTQEMPPRGFGPLIFSLKG